MEAKAILKNARITPRKVCIVLDLIRGKQVDEAMGILKNTRKAASEYLIKLLASATANAVNYAETHNDANFDRNTLYVSECYVCPGPTLKRGQARGRGGYDQLLKRTSHMTIVVKTKD
jgi:large subunit ribosomal protein L22